MKTIQSTRIYSKILSLTFCFALNGMGFAYAQVQGAGSVSSDQAVINLSHEKWKWMSEKKVDTLAKLFHDKAIFVHMGGTMSKEQELNVIKSGGIHYKKADIENTQVQLMGHTAILTSKLRLLAVVGGNEVTNPFVVTEVYVKDGNEWQLGSMSFTRLLGQ
jgi:ketosteroid isomerase-like protein